MGVLYKGLSIWVQSRLDPCPNDTYTYIHTTYHGKVTIERHSYDGRLIENPMLPID